MDTVSLPKAPSLPSSATPGAAIPPYRAPLRTDEGEDTFDARWARWLAKGAVQDRRLQQQIYAVGVGIGCGLIAWGAVVRFAG